MPRKRLIWGAAILGLIGLVLLMPTTEDPNATRAVRRYLANLGHEVVETEGAPAGETLIVLADARGADEAGLLLDWADGGGHLVVTDPNSVVVGLAGATSGAPIGFAGTVELRPDCVAPVAAGVQAIVARAGDVALEATDAAFVSCFPAQDGALLLTRRHGAGRVTLVGGSSSLTNGLLREADNAVFAAQLAGSDGVVAFAGPGAAAGIGTGGVWETLPERGRAAVVAIVVAGLAFALVRARRLGRPAVEDPIAPIPANELVRAAARLYRRTRATEHAGRILREAAFARLARRFRSGADGSDAPGVLARATGLPESELTAVLLGPPPRTDDELITLGQELEALAMRAERRSR